MPMIAGIGRVGADVVGEEVLGDEVLGKFVRACVSSMLAMYTVSAARAPSSAVSPETATDHPPLLYAFVPRDASLTPVSHAPLVRRNTYAAPISGPGAPITAVSPEMATDTAEKE